MKNKSLKILGYLLTSLSFYYIYLSFKKNQINIHSFVELFDKEHFYYLLLSLILYMIVLYLSAYFWSYLVRCLSRQDEKNKINLVKIYAQSNLGKYLPGNFMQFVGRNVLGKNLGFTHSEILYSTLIDMGYVIITGITLLLILSLFDTFSLASLLDLSFLSTDLLIVVLIGVLIGLVLFAIFKKHINKYFKNIQFNFILKTTLLRGVFLYSFIFMVLGLANYLILNIFLIDFNTSDYFKILYVFIVSWLVGFVIPGAPGGIGIREAIFIHLLSQSYTPIIVASVPILFRLINIIGDVIFFLLNVKKHK